LSGLKMFVKYPYVLGIFSMLFFYEMFNMVLNFQRLCIAQDSYSRMSDVTGFLFKQIFATHALGFVISLFGTGLLLKWLGERKCLLLIPLITALFVLYFMFNYTPESLIITYVGIRAVHYAFSYPVRESLYIPTVKEMKFKSKSWIDAFGIKFAKATGQGFNAFVLAFCQNIFFGVHMAFFGLILGLWFVASFLLGKRYQKAIDNKEVIGRDLQPAEE